MNLVQYFGRTESLHIRCRFAIEASMLRSNILRLVQHARTSAWSMPLAWKLARPNEPKICKLLLMIQVTGHNKLVLYQMVDSPCSSNKAVSMLKVWKFLNHCQVARAMAVTDPSGLACWTDLRLQRRNYWPTPPGQCWQPHQLLDAASSPFRVSTLLVWSCKTEIL